MTAMIRMAAALSVAALWGLTLAPGAQAQIAAVLETERAAVSDVCTQIAFLDGFARPVDANADGLDDLVIHYGLLECDGMAAAYCGSGGCTQHLYLQRAGGRYEQVGDFLAYDLTFDRPAEASFLAALHGSACGTVGAMGCLKRYRVSGAGVVEMEAGAAPGPAPSPAPSPAPMTKKAK